MGSCSALLLLFWITQLAACTPTTCSNSVAGGSDDASMLQIERVTVARKERADRRCTEVENFMDMIVPDADCHSWFETCLWVPNWMAAYVPNASSSNASGSNAVSRNHTCEEATANVKKCKDMMYAFGSTRGLCVCDQQKTCEPYFELSGSAPISSPARVHKPLVWLHVQKCATAWMNVMLSNDYLCPGGHGLPHKKVTNYEHDLEGNVSKKCPQSFRPKNLFEQLSHQPVGKSLLKYESVWSGAGVTVVRQPEQRLLSSYYYTGYDRDLQNGSFIFPGQWPNTLAWPFKHKQTEAKNISEYARVMEGHMVKMLTKDGIKGHIKKTNGRVIQREWQMPYGKPTHEDLKEALRRLRGFAFVGLMEKWDLTVCLFHTMFPSKCYTTEFKQTNKGPQHSDHGYDTSVLNGYVDKYDGAVYAEASKIFHENLKKYKVSNSSCQQCWKDANHTH